jgi:dynein heavy chain 1
LLLKGILLLLKSHEMLMHPTSPQFDGQFPMNNYHILNMFYGFGRGSGPLAVENLDPIINPVLNRELRRTGGRVLIRLGGQDIDFSPSFTLFLSTRDPSVNFPPDVCSRVTFVNFTVTKGSLQVQCLNKVLKSESPETDQKRSDLIKLQGEFRLRLRHLEKSLLQAPS